MYNICSVYVHYTYIIVSGVPVHHVHGANVVEEVGDPKD